ncbi:MAG: DUF4160 domain-containing protein [Bacteroidaceae bacterium]|nr:DUF4160 domain-containing protein [Bacteroidaceae bacterium]
MPKIFRIGSYWVYFWSNENSPLEPIHVHISEGAPSPNATKIWITQARKCLMANNNSNINPHILQNIMRIIEARCDDVVKKWLEHFNSISYYC